MLSRPYSKRRPSSREDWGVSINTTAKEISQYSYLYSLTGLNDRDQEIYNAGMDQVQMVKDRVNDVHSAYNEMSSSLTAVFENEADAPVDLSNFSMDQILGKWESISGLITQD